MMLLSWYSHSLSNLASFVWAHCSPVLADADAVTDRTGLEGLTGNAIAVVDEAVSLLRPMLCDEKGTWTADYVRLRFKAHLPDDHTSGMAVDVSRS